MMFGFWSNHAGRPPWGGGTFEAFTVAMLSPQPFLPHHFPFRTDVRPRAQDDKQTRLVGQMQKMLQISISCEVGDPFCCFVEVPGDISEWTCRDQSKEHVSMCVKDWGGMILHLDGVQTSHVHLQEPVLPVVWRDSGVVDAAWDVLKRFPVLKETVVPVVYRKWPHPKDL